MTWISHFVRSVWSTAGGRASLCVLCACILLAVLGPTVAPHGPFDRLYNSTGRLMRLKPPSAEHWLGTTVFGRDVLSQMLWGARPALIVGFATAFGVAAIGVNVGLISGYFGGRINSVMMRITDIFLGLPFLPFIIVMLAITGRSTTTIIVAMTLIMWRSAARVIRAQVLSIKQMPFVAAARTTGAGDFTILYREIAPNVMPIALVNISFALAWAIITEASIGFLGYGDPKSVSWGTIIHDAYASQMMYSGPWWALPPGIAIMILVSSVYFVGRAYEDVINPRLVMQ